MSEAIIVVWWLAVLAELGLFVRLLMQRLGGVYPGLLVASGIFTLQQTLLILTLAPSGSTTQIVWKLTEPLVWLLWTWIVLELFSKWTRSYAGIGQFGRYLFVALMAAALVISVTMAPIEWRTPGFGQVFRVYYILNRVLMAALALFTLLLWLFFRNYPVPVAANVSRHTFITVAYLSLNALVQLAFTLGGLKTAPVVNLSLVVLSAGSFSAWAILLTQRGEAKESIPIIPPEEIAKTERINRELLALMRSLPEEVGVGKY
jgi:hypothetical protein